MELTSALMLKYTAIAVAVSIAAIILGGIWVRVNYSKDRYEDLPGIVTAICGCAGMAFSMLAFFIALLWHIIKSFTGG